MTAWQRTNILEREEKGMGPISFKRLLLSGGAGLLVSMLAGRIVGFTMGCVGGAALIAAVLILTHPRDGFPLYSYLLRTFRGLATISAIEEQSGMLATAAKSLQINPSDGILSSGGVFNAPGTETDSDLFDTEWAFLGSFSDADDEGVAAVEHPFAAASRSL
jgi:hypothetical protein